MTRVFADSFFFLAINNPRDAAHIKATTFSSGYKGLLVSTAWVLTEVADALADPKNRPDFLALHQYLSTDPLIHLVPPTQDLFDRGIALFQKRPDKSWSLTDCISFVVMQDHGLTEALTGDHHFEQAGFAALLK